MADAELSILIKARNEAKAEFDKLNGQVKTLGGQSGIGGLNNKLSTLSTKFQSVTGVSLGFASAAGLAAGAAKGLWEFLKSSVEETVKYQSEIKDLSRLLGMNTEETSRLVQASDDLFLSQESLSTALQAATRKGVDTSIEGIKRLSEQYLKLNPGVERGKFLMDNFGRSGSEMGKLLEVGADGISKAMGAIDESLVVTQQAIIDTENYKRSVDNLGDAWQGVKYTIGREIIPQLDLLLRVLTPGKDAVEEHEQAVNRLKNQMSKLAAAAAMGNDSAKARLEELRLELENLNNYFYNAETGVYEYGESLYGLQNSIIPTSAYMQALTKEMLFNQAAAGLDETASLALAESMGLVNSNTSFALNALQGWRSELDAGKITMDEYRARVSKLGSEWEKLGLMEDINLSANFNFNLHGIGEAEKTLGIDLNGNGIIGAKKGADFTVPPGYPNDSLIMGVTSGEHVQVTPAGKTGGGNNVNVYLTYAPAMSLSDRTDAETKLVPILKRALARAA